MQKITLGDYLEPVYAWLARFAAGPRWQVKALALSFLLTLTFQFPEYQYLYRYAVSHANRNDIYVHFLRQVAEPLRNHTTDAESHQAKMTFRLAVPLLARGLHLNIFGVFTAQLLLGLTMHWGLLALLARLAQDRVSALLLAWGTCFTYYGAAYLHDIYCYFDAFGYALLLLMLTSRRPVVTYLCCLVGGFVDERVLVASLLVVLWHCLRAPGEVVPQVRAPGWTASATAIVAAWCTYGGLRLGLTTTYGLVTYGGAVGLSAVRENVLLQRTALGFITGLEFYWLLPLLALALLALHRQRVLALALAGASLPILGGSFLVYDITRSLAYGFPVALLSLTVLSHYLPRNSVRHLALVVAVGAVLVPNYHYHQYTDYAESVFLKAFKYFVALYYQAN